MAEFRKLKVYVHDKFAGILSESEFGYLFIYDDVYMKSFDAVPIGIGYPLTTKEYKSKILFPIFDGIIPEGWVLNVVIKNWKLNSKDRFAILAKSSRDPIGAIHIEEFNENK